MKKPLRGADADARASSTDADARASSGAASNGSNGASEPKRRLVTARKKWKPATGRMSCSFCRTIIEKDALVGRIRFTLCVEELERRLASPALAFDDEHRPLPSARLDAYAPEAPALRNTFYRGVNAYAWLVPTPQLQCRPCAIKEVEKLDIKPALKAARDACFFIGGQRRGLVVVNTEFLGAVDLAVTRAAYDWHPWGGCSLETLARVYVVRELLEETRDLNQQRNRQIQAAFERLGLRLVESAAPNTENDLPGEFTSDRRIGRVGQPIPSDLANGAAPEDSNTPILSSEDYTILSFIARHGRTEAAKQLSLSPGALIDVLDQIQRKLYRAKQATDTD